MQNKKELSKKIVVTGGGSGGHTSAASSIISAIRDEYNINDNNFLYIGGDLGMVGEQTGNSIEMKVFEKEEFKKKYIRAGKLQRTFEFESIKLFLRTFLGFIDSYRIIKEFKPDIVISTGGFVSVPVALVAKLFKAKIYLHEQTAIIGLANKIVGKIAEKIFVTFPSSAKYFSKDKVIQTGNLVRKEIFNSKGDGPLSSIIKEMVTKQEKHPIIYISGGSLGSHLINCTVKEAMKILVNDFQIILQTGDNKVFNDYESLQLEKKKLDSKYRENIYITQYINNDDIGFLYKNTDLFVGRSGANTVYEIGVLEIPAIFIPIPWVTHNEQRKNAEILTEIGLAEIIEEGELTSEKLVHEINRFYKKDKKTNQEELKKIFIKDASKKILENIDI